MVKHDFPIIVIHSSEVDNGELGEARRGEASQVLYLFTRQKTCSLAKRLVHYFPKDLFTHQKTCSLAKRLVHYSPKDLFTRQKTCSNSPKDLFTCQKTCSNSPKDLFTHLLKDLFTCQKTCSLAKRLVHQSGKRLVHSPIRLAQLAKGLVH
jgi:hypothetical protein